jgi:hypothetical protein
LDHAEFVDAWRHGRLRVAVNQRLAGQLVSQRLLLPFVGIAIIGLGIALVLWGQIWVGIAVGIVGIVVPRLIKRSAGHFLLGQIATDADLFRAARDAGAITLVDDTNPANAETRR